MNRSIIALLTLILTASVAVPTAATSMRDFGYLNGSWNCIAGKQKYTESWSPALGGAFMRATDRTPGKSDAEHTVSLAKDGRTMTVVDLYGDDGSSDVVRGNATSTHATLNAVYPAQLKLSVIFNRITPSKYVVDVSGLNPKGKPFRQHNVCTKA